MKQHFKVGELVVLCTEDNPEINGNICTVIKYNGYSSYISLNNEINKPDHHYVLNIMVSNGNSWAQSALRKYYPPATKTFTEIMQELKKPATS